MGFRIRKSVGCSYVRQGYIYFTSRSFSQLPRGKKEKLRQLCREVGGEYEQALFEFVTTDRGGTAICLKHHIASRTTLDKLVREYYERFPKTL